MARILVAGGLRSDDPDEQLGDARTRFAGALGRRIVARDHVLLGGCRTGLDAEVARAAAEEAESRDIDPKKVVKSWVTGSNAPSHNHGEVVRSQVENWSDVPRRYMYPEPIREADVVIILGGWDGTHYAASWSRLAGKPLVPIASFGLAAEEIFDDELHDFAQRYAGRVSRDDYQTLNRVLPDRGAEAVDSFAADVVSLAERLVRSTEVFVVMSFAEDPELLDAYDTFVRVCEKAGLLAFKIDDHLDTNQRIIPAIMDAIHRSAFVIADISVPAESQPRPNVYYELGYAQALGKDVIVTAKEGTELPFDIIDVPTQYWRGQRELSEKLTAKIRQLVGKHRLTGSP